MRDVPDRPSVYRAFIESPDARRIGPDANAGG